MKCIPKNLLNTISLLDWNPETDVIGLSVADPIYPVTNVNDLHPRNISRATTNTAVYVIDVDEGCDSISLFNCNASEITIKIYDEFDVEITEYGSSYNMTGITTYQQLITDDTNYSQEIHHEYQYIYTTHKIRVFITAKGVENVSCGVIFIGALSRYRNPSYGVTQTLKDFSVISELNSGATYILQRPNVRIFRFDVDFEDREGDPENLLALNRIFREVGPQPIPWLITDKDNKRWLVFARKNSEPNNSSYAYNRTKTSVELIEVL